jgi:hypothetical protein
MLPTAAADNYRTQQRRSLLAIREVRKEWSTIGAGFDWSTVGPRIVGIVSLAQLGSARAAAEYVPSVLEQQRIDVTPDADLNPRGFAGLASSLDGAAYGSLDSLLYGAVVHARTEGATFAERLSAGSRFLDMAVQTQVADAGRLATSAAVTARPRIGYVRMVNPPCCQRCAVLAGRVYRHSTSFKRHPGCDCTMLPTTVTNPDAPGIKIGPDDVKDLTQAQRQAIADGADFNRVINSHRAGARSKDLMTTSAFKGRARRLTPEGIYKVSATREEALKRLRDNGYLL